MNNQQSLLITQSNKQSNNNQSLNIPIDNKLLQTQPIINTSPILYQTNKNSSIINNLQTNKLITNLSNNISNNINHINIQSPNITQSPNQYTKSQLLNNSSQLLNNRNHINNQLKSNNLQQQNNNQQQNINSNQSNINHNQINKQQQSKTIQQSQSQNIIHNLSNYHHDSQIKQFQIQFQNYTFIFSLINNQFKIKGSKQLNQIHLNQTYSYQKFTQQMKALFQNPNQIWTILNQDQQNIQFQIQTHKLYFKIHLGGKQKRINIPLLQNKQNDQQYIKTLQKTINKYIQKNKQLQNQIKQLKQSCNCRNNCINKQIQINNINSLNKINNKEINPKTKNKIKIQRDWLSSRASSTWPQFQIQPKISQQIQLQKIKINKLIKNKQRQRQSAQINNSQQNVRQQQDNDPIIMFDQLICTLNIIRDEFSSLIGQIQGKIQLRAGLKIIRIKMLSLQKKKRDYLSELQQQRKKFIEFRYKKDIDKQIDQLVQFIINKYQTLQTKINLIIK